MDQLICASLSYTHYWYEVGMLKVPAVGKPHSTCPIAGNIIYPFDSARREALVRDVPPAEAPAESAAKKRQCERSHRSKEREDCAIRATATGGWPEEE